jgi:hypothetical protein
VKEARKEWSTDPGDDSDLKTRDEKVSRRRWLTVFTTRRKVK